MINRENYESFFVDYLDGKLSGEEMNMFANFLEQNPDIEDKLHEYESITLNNEPVFLKNKISLKKSLADFNAIDNQNFPEFCIAHFEKELGSKEETLLNEFLTRNPDRKHDFELFRKTYLKPELHVRFLHKSSLKKWTIIRLKPVLYTVTSLAAAWLLYVGVAGVLQEVKNSIRPVLAEQGIKADTRELNNNLVTELKNGENNFLNGSRNTEKSATQSKTRISYVSAEIPDQSYTARESIVLSTLEPHFLSKLDIPYQRLPNLMISYELPRKKQPETGYLNIREYAIRQIKSKVLSEGEKESQDKKITFWEVAEVGVERIGKLTGSDIKLDRKVDESGNLVALAFESKSLGFSHTIRK
jgi:hypothetical protein